MLLINPALGMSLPFHQVGFFEPQSNFTIGILNTVTSMTNVSSNFNTVVSTNGSLSRIQWIRRTQQLPSSLDCIFALPYHTNNRSRQHEGSQAGKESLGNQITVMFIQDLCSGHANFECHQFVPLGFKTSNDGAHQSTLDAVRLNLCVCVSDNHAWVWGAMREQAARRTIM